MIWPMKMRNVLLLLTPANPKRLEGIALFAKRQSWHLTVADHLTHSLDGWRGDGALVTMRNDAKMLSYVHSLISQGVCTVDLSLTRPDIRIPRVAGDNAAIGRMAAEHFKAKRYRHAAWYSTGWGHQHELRYAAFAEAMGGKCEKLVWERAARKTGAGDWNALSGWLKEKLGKMPHPLAVFCFDDADASCLESAAIESGLSVPGDVAVLGVGDDLILCENQTVPISSVQHDIRRIGYAGAALLERLMNGGEAPEEPILIKPSGIAERASTDALAISSDIVRRARDIYAGSLAKAPSTVQLAETLGISRTALDRAFASDIGLSPQKMLMHLKLGEAKRLMTSTDLSLAEIADRLGYCNPAYFTNIFKEATGSSPKRWRSANGKPSRRSTTSTPY